MKKQNALIAAILSLIPLGQPLVVKTSLVLSTTGVMLYVPEKVHSEIGRKHEVPILLCNHKPAEKKEKSGDYYGAISEYTKCIEIQPTHYLNYIFRGLLKYKIKDYEGAISDFTISLYFNKLYGPYNGRGVVKDKIKDYEGAISDFTKAIELVSSRPASYLLRGRTKKKIGALEDACSDWTIANYILNKKKEDLKGSGYDTTNLSERDIAYIVSDIVSEEDRVFDLRLGDSYRTKSDEKKKIYENNGKIDTIEELIREKC